MDNNRYFYVSGLLSFLLFSTFLYLFIYLMFHKSTLNSFALNKKEFITVSLVTTPTKVKNNHRKSTHVVATKNKSVSKKSIDINDLFSDVWTRKITQSKKIPIDNKNLDAIQKKISTLNVNESQTLDEKLHSVIDLSNKENNASTSTANEVNEYLAKIHALVYENFDVPSNSEGYSVKTLIVLNALGQLVDFRVLTYSSNIALNSEADNIKNRLKNVVFPLSPDNKSTTTVVILTSQKE